jgi:hypothetical protein
MVVAAMLSISGTAWATEPVVTSNLDLVGQHAVRGGAAEVPNVACGTTCSDWWLEEHRPIPNQPASDQLHRELRTLRIRTRLLPLLRGAGVIGLGIETFEVGFKIGSGLNAKFLKIGVPDPGDTPPWSPDAPQQLSFRDRGEWIYDGLVFPYDGWYWQWLDASGQWSGFWVTAMGAGDAEIGCPSHVHPRAIPAGLTEFTGAPHPNCGSYSNTGDPTANGGVAHLAATPEDALPARSPIEDYTGQPYEKDLGEPDTAAAPQSAIELQDRVGQLLASGEVPLLAAWYAHRLEPYNYPDPTTLEERDESQRRCDSGGSYKNRTGTSNPEPHAPKISSVFATSIRPSGAPNAPDPYLRWGTTEWKGAYLDRWDGWGWRHIQAKHGWTEGPGPTDEGLTRQALANPVSTEPAGPTSMVYIGPELEFNGAICQRRVVVQYATQTGDPPDTPKGIITSYGEYVRGV